MHTFPVAGRTATDSARFDTTKSDARLQRMKTGIPRDNLVPASLIPEIEAAAGEEHRDPRELVAEAISRYLSERRLFRPDEVHRKVAEGLESLRQGRGVDGETAMAELMAELDAPQ